MFLDARDGDRSRFEQSFDACIVGAGPAGITLARALAAKGLEVALMEGGGLEVSTESQDLYAGEVVGLDYEDLDTVRLRALGGCSGHWSGRCRALDAEAFDPMPHRPLAWPISRAELDPYQPATAEILDLALPHQPADLPVVQAEDRLRGIRFQFSPPTRFGDKYRDELAAAPRILTCLNANLVDLRLDSDLAMVTEAVFKSYTPGDPGFSVRARAFVLAMGGFENPRMLLNLTAQKPAGIGNDHDLVGRYFCEHPSGTVAEALFTHGQAIEEDNFAPTPALMEAEGILGFTVKVVWRDYPVEPLGAAVKSSLECVAPVTRHLSERMLGRVPNCRWGGVEEYLTRRYPDSHPAGRIWIATEQALNRDSRVSLGAETDALGLRRIRFDWQLTELDYRTMQTALVTLGAHFAEADLGRIRIHDWLLADAPRLPADVGGGYHQMCTTRMADDPREGVVDRNCRVHGTENLYIGGSSVFGTPSFCNPTYTIVQLALRLGDHLGGTVLL